VSHVSEGFLIKCELKMERKIYTSYNGDTHTYLYGKATGSNRKSAGSEIFIRDAGELQWSQAAQNIF